MPMGKVAGDPQNFGEMHPHGLLGRVRLAYNDAIQHGLRVGR